MTFDNIELFGEGIVGGGGREGGGGGDVGDEVC